eukprot:6187753-Pleurochrysis_carterae.AAC.1
MCFARRVLCIFALSSSHLDLHTLSFTRASSPALRRPPLPIFPLTALPHSLNSTRLHTVTASCPSFHLTTRRAPPKLLFLLVHRSKSSPQHLWGAKPCCEWPPPQPPKLTVTSQLQDFVAHASGPGATLMLHAAKCSAVTDDGSAEIGLFPYLTLIEVVLQHICTTLWANDVVVTRCLRHFDVAGTGALSVADMTLALHTANLALGEPISFEQIVTLARALPRNDD